MQNHVKLEIALEVIVNKIANLINEIKKTEEESERQKKKKDLKELLSLKEKAYKGDFDVVEKILENGNEV